MSDLRVSDADRERAAAEIREHYAAGRLTDEELSERLAAAYAARTESDLQQALADLPVLPPSVAEHRTELAQRRSQLRRQVVQQSGGAATLFLICCLIWLASGANGQFWPEWVAIPVLITLLRDGWRLYGPAPELDALEADLDRRRRERERRAERADRRARRHLH